MTPEERNAWHALIEGVAAGRELQSKRFDGVWVTTEQVIHTDTTPSNYRLKPVEPRSVEGYIPSDAFSERDRFVFYKEPVGQGIRVRITEVL